MSFFGLCVVIVICPQHAIGDAIGSGHWVLRKYQCSGADQLKELQLRNDDFKLIVEASKITIVDSGKRVEYGYKRHHVSSPTTIDVVDVIRDDDGGRSPLKCIVAVEKDVLKVKFFYALSRADATPYFDRDAPRPKDFTTTGEIPWVVLYFVKDRAIKK